MAIKYDKVLGDLREQDSGGGGGGDMFTATYDPAGLANQVTVKTIHRTVAQINADMVALDIIEGQQYEISGIYGNPLNTFRTKGTSTESLELKGTGIYSNPSMVGDLEVEMGYIVSADYIYFIYDPKYDNEIIQTSGLDTISKMPLDQCDAGRDGSNPTSIVASTFKHNRLNNVAGSWIAYKTEIRNTRAEDCTINTSSVGNSTCFIWNVDIKVASVLTLIGRFGTFDYVIIGSYIIGSAYVIGSIGNGASVTLDAAVLWPCDIGPGKNVDTQLLPPGYVSSGHYNSNGSTLAISGGFYTPVNPDATGLIELTNCRWVGAIVITDVISSGGALNFINSLAYDHKLKLSLAYGIAGNLTVYDNTGNLRLTMATITLQDTYGDWIEFLGHPYDSSKLIETARGIYLNP
jgi:hypothetical protein